MAAGDITGQAVTSSGAQTRVTFVVDSLTGASVTASAGDILNITFDCVTEGYTGSTLGTHSRTGIRCKYVSTATSTVTVELEEPIWNDCTSVTMTAAAGAITDGTVSNNALTAQVVDNSSNPLDYPTPVLHCWPTNPAHMFGHATAAYTVDATAVGSQAAIVARNGRFGIADVVLTITDGATVTETYTATGWTPITRRTSLGEFETVPCYRFTVDPADRPSTGTAYPAGFYTHSIVAYPVTGDAASAVSSLAFRVYIDSADAFDNDVAWVDSTADLPMDASVATFTGWNYAKGTTSSAIGILVGTQSGTDLLLTVISGTFDAGGETITEYTDSACTAATGVTGTSTAGTTANASGSPAVGDINNPYATSQAAAFALEGASSSGTASHSTIRYLRGAAIAGPYSFGTRFSTASGCVIMEPDSSAVSAGTAADTTRYCGSTSTGDGLRTQFVHYRNFYMDAKQRVYTTPFSSTAAADGTDPDGEHIVVSGFTIDGTGSTDSTFTIWFAAGVDRAAVYATSVDDSWEGIRGQWNIETRNTQIGQDCWSPTTRTNYIVFNCGGSCNQAGGAGAHSGYFQYLNVGASANGCIWATRGYDDISAALPPTSSGGSGWNIGRVAIVLSIFEGDVTPNDARLLGPCTYTNLFFYNNTMGSRIALGGTTSGANFSNLSYGNNFIMQMSQNTSGTHILPRCGSFNNHTTVGVLASGALFNSWGDTNDGVNNAHDLEDVIQPAFRAQMVDYSNENYRPDPAGDLVDATDYDVDYDATGIAADGYIGALAAAAPVTAASGGGFFARARDRNWRGR